MIIFHTIPNLGIDMVMKYMSSGVIPELSIYSFTIYGETNEGTYLRGLCADFDRISPQSLLNCEDIGFDNEYVNQLLTSEQSWLDLMSIMSVEYECGANSILMVQTRVDSPTADCVTQALIKHIQHRYGCSPCFAETLEDMSDILVNLEDNMRRAVPTNPDVLGKDVEQYAIRRLMSP